MKAVDLSDRFFISAHDRGVKDERLMKNITLRTIMFISIMTFSACASGNTNNVALQDRSSYELWEIVIGDLPEEEKKQAGRELVSRGHSSSLDGQYVISDSGSLQKTQRTHAVKTDNEKVVEVTIYQEEEEFTPIVMGKRVSGRTSHVILDDNAAEPAEVMNTTSYGPTCHTGPRGGTYTITSSGKKNYGGC